MSSEHGTGGRKSRARRAASEKSRVPELNEKQVEALTVAMVLAPGVYVRNRMFDLFTSTGARRARTRASVLRGLIPQLARASGVTISSEGQAEAAPPHAYVLRYQIPAMRLTRVVELSATELSALRVALDRSKVRCCLAPSAEDKDVVASALAWLLDSTPTSVEEGVARLARDLVVAPPST